MNNNKRIVPFFIIKKDRQYLTRDDEFSDEIFKARLWVVGNRNDAIEPFELAGIWSAKVYLLFPNGYNIEVNPFSLHNYNEPPTCEAEDQGGWRGCPNPAKWYITEKKSAGESKEYGKEEYYCDEHRLHNRFWRPESMLPIPE